MIQNIQPRRTPKNGSHFVALGVCGNPDFLYILYADLAKLGIELRHAWSSGFDRLPIDKRQAPGDIDLGFVVKDNILSSKQRDAAMFKMKNGSRIYSCFEVPANNKMIIETIVQQGYFGRALEDKFKPTFAPRAGEMMANEAPPSDTGTPKPEPPPIVAPSDTLKTAATITETEDQIPPDLRRLTPAQRQQLRDGAAKAREAREALGISQAYMGRLIDPEASGNLISQIERPTVIPSNEVCEALDIILGREPRTFPRLGVKNYSRLNLDAIRKRAAAMHHAIANKLPLPTVPIPEPEPDNSPAISPPIAPVGDYYHHPLLAAPYRSGFRPVEAPADFEPTMSTTVGVKRLSLEERKRLYSVGRGLGHVRTNELKLKLDQTWALIDPSVNNKSCLSMLENGSHRFIATTSAALEMLYGVPAMTISPASAEHQNLAAFDLEAARKRIAEWQIAHGLAQPAKAVAAPVIDVPATIQPSPPTPAPIVPVTLPAAVAVAAPVNDNASPAAVKAFFPNPPPSDATLDDKRDWFDAVLRRLRNYLPQVEYTKIEMTATQLFCESVAPTVKSA